MTALIGDLLNLSRISRAARRKESITLTDLVRAVVTELRQREPSPQSVFEIEDGLRARGDPRLITIVLENLLGNAWKFTAKRPEARIVFAREKTSTKAPSSVSPWETLLDPRDCSKPISALRCCFAV